MKYYNIFDLKLQEMHVFITAAEYQSITKAADFLYITPSQVSKIIKKLEHQWGVQLFIHEKNTVRLTPAGKYAYSGLSGIFGNVEKIYTETLNIQKVIPFIRIGLPTLSEPNDLIVPIINEFRKLYSEVSITIECEDTFSELRKKLIGGTVDVVFTAKNEVEENNNILEWRSVEIIPMYIMMNKEHPLAKKEDLQLSDLEFEEFVLQNPLSSRTTYDILQICKQNGFIPRMAHYTPNIYSQMMSLYINPNVVCLQALKDSATVNGLCCRKLPGMFREMGFAYRKDSPKVVAEFVECALQLNNQD